MKKLTVLMLGVVVAGCTTFSDMENGLNYLMGQPVQVAFENLGYPSGSYQIGDDTVYGWGRSFTMNMPTTSTTSVTGTVGTTPYSGYGTTTSYAPVNYACNVKIIAGADGVIKNWEYDGNAGGCGAYSARLKNLGK